MRQRCDLLPAGIICGPYPCRRFPALVGLLLGFALVGCRSSSPSVGGKVDQSRQNLQRIGVAYSQASLTLRRSPRNLDELLTFLRDSKTGVPARDVLRSPDDGEEYVIVWGVDFARIVAAGGDPNVVFAYERRGKRGQRHVMKAPNFVTLMTDSEFRKARFPPGHQPQF